MIADVENRGLDNEHVDALKAAFARIEALGQEHSDIGAFTGACMQEDLYTKLSNHYAAALSAGTSTSANPEDYDDSALLKQTVDALKMSITELKKAKENALAEAAKDPKENLGAASEFAMRFAAEQGIDMQGQTASNVAQSMNDEIDATIARAPAAYDNTAEVEALDTTGDIIQAIEALVALGEQEGMTLPRFLRLQIEQGLDKAMEGAVSTRKALEYELGWAEASAVSPFHIQAAQEKLQVFDTLSAKQQVGVPNWKELQWASKDVEYKYERDQNVFYDITQRWESILNNLSTWALAHCSFAEYVDPWKLLDPSKRRPAIESDKATLPGIIKQKERLLQKYHGISFADIFEHPTFKWAVEKNFIGYSREYIEFLRNTVYPACIPCQYLPQDIISQKEAIYQGKRVTNPNIHVPAERAQIFYDQKFGAGRHEAKFGPISRIESNAAPW